MCRLYHQSAPLFSSTTPSMFGTRHPVSSRSGGPRGDTMSVLLALTVPAALSGWTVFGGGDAIFGGVTVGDGQAGSLGGDLERASSTFQDASNW